MTLSLSRSVGFENLYSPAGEWSSRRRTELRPRRAFALAVAGLLALAGVAFLASPASATIKFQVKGTPLAWQHLNVVFSDIQVHRANAETESGWTSLPLSTTEVDFVTLGNLTQVLSLDRAIPGKYTQLRIVVNAVDGVLDDGTPVSLTVPDGELKTVTPFDLPGGGTVTITLEFDLAGSIHGAGDSWIFRPVLGSLQIS